MNNANRRKRGRGGIADDVPTEGWVQMAPPAPFYRQTFLRQLLRSHTWAFAADKKAISDPSLEIRGPSQIPERPSDIEPA